ncbi:MAG: MinD/ParA family protein [Ignavibacteria bacterium]|nr:MinD/ParA family protein [Ignavibacteria bacterium]
MFDQAAKLRTIASRHREELSKVVTPKLITVTSGKGGVGKSMISLNLSLAIAGLGKRVLLVDVDSNLANLDVLIGMTPTYRLSHVLRGEKTIDEVAVPVWKTMRIIPGSSGDIRFPLIDTEVQLKLFEDLRSLEQPYDYILLDTGAGLNSEVVTSVINTDEALVITTPEPTAVMDAYAVIKTVCLESSEKLKLNLIVNAAWSPLDAEETGRKLQMVVNHFLKTHINYLGFVPYDKNVHHAVLEQQPVILRFPRSASALSIQKIAQTIIKQPKTYN